MSAELFFSSVLEGLALESVFSLLSVVPSVDDFFFQIQIALNRKKCVHTKRQNKQKKLVILSRVRTLRVNVSDFYRVLRTADSNETQRRVQNCYSVVTLK